MPVALVLGATGQDGSYLTQLLLEKGWRVCAFCRRSGDGRLKNLDHLRNYLGKGLKIRWGDLLDPISLLRTIKEVRPAVIYNEADQDNVGVSFEAPYHSYQVTGAAVGNLLEITRQIDPGIKIFQPVSITMLDSSVLPQNEQTAIVPRSPYACAKALAYHLAQHYRREHGMFVSTAILGNHDSCRRNVHCLLHKTIAAVKLIASDPEHVRYEMQGDLSAPVDIGYAPEFVEAIYRIMDEIEPDDFVIATGKAPSVYTWMRFVFERAGLRIDNYLDQNSQKPIPAGMSVAYRGDITKAKRCLDFHPRIVEGALVDRLWKDLEEADQ